MSDRTDSVARRDLRRTMGERGIAHVELQTRRLDSLAAHVGANEEAIAVELKKLRSRLDALERKPATTFRQRLRWLVRG